MIVRLILALLFAVPAFGQVVQLSGGSSTEYNATGGAVTVYAPTFNTSVDAGIFEGKVVGGATANFEAYGWNVHAGDYPLTLTAGDLGLSVPIRGLTAARRRGQTQLTVFSGLIGTAYSSPFFYAQRANQFGAGFAVSTLAHGLELSSAVATTAGRRTYLESVRRRWQHFQLSETGGVLDSRVYAIASANFNADHFSAGLTHNDYIYEGEHAAVNSENISAFARGASVSGSMFQSATVRGSAIGGSYRVGILDIHGTQVISKQNIFLGSVSETLTQHFHISQYYTRSSGTNSFSFGGGYTGNVVSADIGWQMVFYPFLTNAPFQRTLTATLRLQLPWHGTSVNLGTVASPTGGARWTAYAGSYSSLPWELPSNQPQAGAARITGREIRGVVITQDGPLEGAAIRIGRDEVFTNSDGAFIAHVRAKGSVAVEVVLADFLANGNFEVVSAPASISPDTRVEITLRRL